MYSIRLLITITNVCFLGLLVCLLHIKPNDMMMKNYFLMLAMTTLCFNNASAQWTDLNPPYSNYENYTAIGVSANGKNIAMSGISMNRTTFEITEPYTVSSDYGVTWHVRPGKSSQSDYLLWEGDVLYCKSVTSTGVKLIKSIDYGLTFTVIDSAFETNSTSIISNAAGVWYHNLAGNIYESTNKGLNWTLTSTSDINFIDYTIAENGNIIATYNKGIGYSADGGKNWRVATLSTSDTWTDYSSSVSKASNGSLIYLAKSKTRIYKSIDNGVTWQLLAVTPPANIIKLLHSGNDIIAVSTTGATYKCSDETTFTQLTPPVTGILVGASAMAKAGSFVFACGNSGLHRYGTGNTTNVVEKELTEVSIYPNPTADILTVLSTNNFEGFEIYNLLGEKICDGSLLNNQINTAPLNYGIYQLVLRSNKGLPVMLKFCKN